MGFLVFLIWISAFDPAVLNQRGFDFTDSYLHHIEKHRNFVPEFQFMRHLGQRMGIKVYLFGGTAATFAQYCREDFIKSLTNDQSYKGRFDYDFMSIFRSTQDIDIVIDGSEAQLLEFQRQLLLEFPYNLDANSKWELRLLRQSSGAKGALLGDFDFLNQHSDSQSTGLIEITDSNDSIVRDLRFWNEKNPPFLRDTVNRSIHFYFSENHSKTLLAESGRNPPIFSVIRYFIKAFQFDLSLDSSDHESIKRIIDQFSPESYKSGPLRTWMETKAVKLFSQSVNVEFAWDQLEKFGLRKKLILIGNNIKDEGSLAWWMNREPLRSRELGRGTGLTAAQLGISKVSHETKSFLAYESLIADREERANAFISRPNHMGEAAIHGAGHYTRIGFEGLGNTGLTVRYSLNPNAREYSDFMRAEQDFVLILNKNAIRVDYEMKTIDIVGYFSLEQSGLDIRSNQGIFQMVKRRIVRDSLKTSSEQINKVLQIVADELKKISLPVESHSEISRILTDWFDLPISLRLLEPLISSVGSPLVVRILALTRFKSIQNIRDDAEIVRWMIDNGSANEELLRVIRLIPKGDRLRKDLISRILQRNGIPYFRAERPSLKEKRFSKSPRLTWKKSYSDWISIDDLKAEIQKNLLKSPLLRKIVTASKSRGIETALIGESALYFADYVLSDVLHRRGHPDFKDFHGSYRWEDIFHSRIRRFMNTSVKILSSASASKDDFWNTKDSSQDFTDSFLNLDWIFLDADGRRYPKPSSDIISSSILPIFQLNSGSKVSGQMDRLLDVLISGQLRLLDSNPSESDQYQFLRMSFLSGRRISQDSQDQMANYFKSPEQMGAWIGRIFSKKYFYPPQEQEIFIENFFRVHLAPLVKEADLYMDGADILKKMGIDRILEKVRYELKDDPSSMDLLSDQLPLYMAESLRPKDFYIEDLKDLSPDQLIKSFDKYRGHPQNIHLAFLKYLRRFPEEDHWEESMRVLARLEEFKHLKYLDFLREELYSHCLESIAKRDYLPSDQLVRFPFRVRAEYLSDYAWLLIKFFLEPSRSAFILRDFKESLIYSLSLVGGDDRNLVKLLVRHYYFYSPSEGLRLFEVLYRHGRADLELQYWIEDSKSLRSQIMMFLNRSEETKDTQLLWREYGEAIAAGKTSLYRFNIEAISPEDWKGRNGRDKFIHLAQDILDEGQSFRSLPCTNTLKSISP